MFRISLVECPSSYVNKYIGIRLSFIRVSGTLIYRKWGIFASKEKPSQKWLFADYGLSCCQIWPPGEAAVGPLPPSVVGLHISNWWKKERKKCLRVYFSYLLTSIWCPNSPGWLLSKEIAPWQSLPSHQVCEQQAPMWQLPSVLGVTKGNPSNTTYFSVRGRPYIT